MSVTTIDVQLHHPNLCNLVLFLSVLGRKGLWWPGARSVESTWCSHWTFFQCQPPCFLITCLESDVYSPCPFLCSFNSAYKPSKSTLALRPWLPGAVFSLSNLLMTLQFGFCISAMKPLKWSTIWSPLIASAYEKSLAPCAFSCFHPLCSTSVKEVGLLPWFWWGGGSLWILVIPLYLL